MLYGNSGRHGRGAETRLQQAQAEPMAPIDLLSRLVADELAASSDCSNVGTSAPEDTLLTAMARRTIATITSL